MSPLHSTDDLLLFLRRAYIRGMTLSREQRRQLLKICLAYLCKDTQGRGMREKMLATLAQAYGIVALTRPVDAGAPDQKSDLPQSENWDLLEPLLQRYYGRSLPEQDYSDLLQRLLKEFDGLLRQVCQTSEVSELTWREMLLQGKAGQEQMDHAMQLAAKESFDRLLSALNPEGAKKQTERKKWHITPLYKSDLYDAMVEKYGQLKAYHDKGRMLRDFRSLFRMYYKDNVKNSESP